MHFSSWNSADITFQYYRSASLDPSVLFIAGFHGDETDCIPLLTECLNTYSSVLPSFLYIPYACPSAVAAKKRTNKNGRDINRSYYLYSVDEEARALIEFLRVYSFKTVYSFHEDPDQHAFYLYDMAIHPERESFDDLFAGIERVGVPIFTGIDDPDDLSLNQPIQNGYVGFSESMGMAIQHGFFNEFTFHTQKSERHITFEIPGAISIAQKDAVVQQIFNSYILRQT